MTDLLTQEVIERLRDKVAYAPWGAYMVDGDEWATILAVLEAARKWGKWQMAVKAAIEDAAISDADFITAMTERDAAIDGHLLPYRCDDHGGFHLGHFDPRGQRARDAWGGQAQGAVRSSKRRFLQG